MADPKHATSGFCLRDVYNVATGAPVNPATFGQAQPGGDVCLDSVPGDEPRLIGYDVGKGKPTFPSIGDNIPDIAGRVTLGNGIVGSAGVLNGASSAYAVGMEAIRNDTLYGKDGPAEKHIGVGVAYGIDDQTTLTATGGVSLHGKGVGEVTLARTAPLGSGELTIAGSARTEGGNTHLAAGAVYKHQFGDGKYTVGVGGGLTAEFGAASQRGAGYYAQASLDAKLGADWQGKTTVGYNSQSGLSGSVGAYTDVTVQNLPLNVGPQVEANQQGSLKIGLGVKMPF